MAKPRIIILMHYMELGGAEMALLGLLGALDPSKVDVDLFIYSHRGPLMRFIPVYVNLLPEIGAYSIIERPIIKALRKGHFGVVLGRMQAKWQCRNYRRKYPAKGDDMAIMQYVGDCVTPWLPPINPTIEYDLCISFLTPHNIGRDKVRAKKHLAWIHTDYSNIRINTSKELPVWSAYDTIASISKDVTNSFVKSFPSLTSKILLIENILPATYIRKRADEFDPSLEFSKSNAIGEIKILSIGRYTNQKNFDNVPDIARRMIANGIGNLKWYIIGYGGDEQLIRKKIAEAGMEDHVIILGKKENPYPYIKACDIYVQPSRYEGKSITVREAQMLGKPVAVTAYPTATSQINNGLDGVIVPLDNDGCAKGLTELINNPIKMKSLSEYCLNHDFANTAEVNKIYELLK